MQSKKTISHRQGKQILSFALMLAFAAGFVAFAFVSTAQEAVVVNRAAAPQINAANLPKATVRGRILYEDNGKPVRRMPFTLVRLSQDAASNSNAGAGGQGGVTDMNGEFELRSVVYGKYLLNVEAPNVLNPERYYESNTANYSADAETNRVAAAQEFVAPPNGFVEVTIRVKRGAAIGGKIVYADGEPAAKVSVAVTPKNRWESNVNGSNANTLSNYSDVATATTDDRGVYRINGLEPGEYTVRVTERTSHNAASAGYALYSEAINSFLSLFYRDATEESKAQTIRLNYGQELADIDFTLANRPLYKAAGKVVARNTKQPIPNARIYISKKTPADAPAEYYNPRESLGEMIADENGAFDLIDLPPGKYTASVRSPSENTFYDPVEGEPQPVKASFVATEKDFEIENRDLADLIVELAPGATISGRITVENGRTPNYASFAFYDSEQKASLSGSAAFADSSGTKIVRTSAPFEVVNAQPGKYTIGVYAGYYSEEDQRNPDKTPFAYLKTIKRGNSAIEMPLEIKEGETISDLELILATDGGRVKGVLRRNNQIAKNQKILAFPVDAAKWNDNNRFSGGFSDERGEYQIIGAPGEYFVTAFSETEALRFKPENLEAFLAFLRERSASAARVTIRPNAIQNVNLTVP